MARRRFTDAFHGAQIVFRERSRSPSAAQGQAVKLASAREIRDALLDAKPQV
jgi:hypothetical protein